jgi:hypothetical protein
MLESAHNNDEASAETPANNKARQSTAQQHQQQAANRAMP